MEMLVQHRKSLNEQIRQLQEHEAKLDEKIAFYQQEPAVPVIFGHMGGSNWMDVIAFAKEHGQAYLDLSAAILLLLDWKVPAEPGQNRRTDLAQPG